MKGNTNGKNLKEKILFASIICLLFVSCGGGGGSGGGGSTNLPIRPEISPSVPKKDIPDNALAPNKPNEGVVDPALPNIPEPKKEKPNENLIPKKDIPDNALVPNKPNEGVVDPALPNIPEPEKEKLNENLIPKKDIPIEPDSSMQGSFIELRKKLGEDRFKAVLLEARKKSNEPIPVDNRNLNGSEVKVAILDSDFIKNRIKLKNIYSNIEILDRIPQTDSNTKEHGEKVLGVLRERSSIGVIGVSIGKTGDSTEVIPNEASYKSALEKFNPEQKVKIFNQSFGSGKEMIDDIYEKYQNKESNRIAALAPGQESVQEALEEGKKIYEFYDDTIKEKGGLFIWAAGNKGENNNDMYHASIQAGLPKYYRNFEEGWISVVGIDSKNEGGVINAHRANRMAYAGEAAWWSISADYSSSKGGIGSSYAAPRVSRAAALVTEKFSWMTPDQVRQTLFTTTDRTEISINETKRKISIGSEDDISSKYGWGMLNTERALKGPGSFINILSQYKNSPDINNIFKADIPAEVTSYFENDIYGNGGLEKLGEGTLHLTGNNSYKRGSIVSNGTLEVHKIHANQIDVKESGTLVLHSRAIVGYQNDPFIIRIDENDIKPSNIISKNVENKGTVKFIGSEADINGQKFKGTAIIGGDYIAYPDSKTDLDFNSKVAVLGNININGKVHVLSDKYVAGTLSKTLMSGKEINGKIEEVLIEGMKTANAKVAGGDLVVELSRQNVVDYIGNAEASSKNVAQNVENVFADLDQKVKAGTASQEELIMGAAMQTMSASTFSAATERMSGEIYASAQALTFSQAQNINRDLSNRLAGLDNLKLSNGESQTWFSAIGSDGKLRREGYASADTRVAGGQFGLDKKINNNTNLGLALAYSHASADFNRYAGNSKSDMVGISLYGKQEWANNFYAAGRLGISHVSTKVERELIDGAGNTVQGRVKHDDIMSSVYLEVGKSFKWLTPFVGYSQDYLRRGGFSESNAAWGIHADSKNYWNSNFLVGLRAEFALNKYKFQTYITQAINVGKRDLAYEGHFTGSTVKQRYEGVKQAKNTTWIGGGVFREITPNFGIYGNIDFRMEDGKRADSVFSAGLQFKF